MGTKPDKHIHKFRRLRYKSGNEVFFCVLPDCRVKMSTALAFGKRSICWRCENPFLMTDYSLRLSKPHCDACHVHKNKQDAPWIHEPSEIEKEAVKDLAKAVTDWNPLHSAELSLAERLQQVMHGKQIETNTTNSEIDEEEL